MITPAPRRRTCLTALNLFISVGVACSAQAQPRPTYVPAGGIAIGGIGAGCIRVMPDGRVRGATINNNWYRPMGELPGCFAAVYVRSGKQSTAKVITTHGAYGLPAPASLDCDAVFPQIRLHCPQQAFPDADVTLRVFSPFIPGDVRSSSIPGAIYLFHLVNLSALPITTAVALSWENTLGTGQTLEGAAFENRDGDTITSIPDSEGYFGLRFSSGAADRLNQDHDGAAGDMTLMTHPERNAAVVTTAGWNARDASPAWWNSFEADGVVSGSAPEGVPDSRPAGVVAVQVTLKPHQELDIPTCITWYTPAMRSAGGEDYGHFYQVSYQDSSQVAHALLGDWQMLLALTEDWQKQILRSSLPDAVARRVIDSASALISDTVQTKDGRFSLLPAAASAETHEAQSYLQVRARAANLVLDLFPQLYSQEMVELLQAEQATGVFPENPKDWSARIGPARLLPDERPDGAPIDFESTPPPAARHDMADRFTPQARTDAALFMLQADEQVQETGNLVFLQHAIGALRASFQPVLGAIEGTQHSRPHPLARQDGPEQIRVAAESIAAAEWLASVAVTHTMEWEPAESPFGPAPAALVEIAAEERFIDACRAAASRLSAGRNGTLTSDQLTPVSIPDAPPDSFDGVEDWGILRSVEGYRFDPESGVMSLTTPIPGTWRMLTAPIFSPVFSGRVEFKPTAHGGLLTLRLDRTISLSPVRSFRRRAGASGATQLVLRSMRIAPPPPTSTGREQPLDVHVSKGQNPVGCSAARGADGVLIVTFDSPLTLLTGDLVQITVH